LFFAVILVFSFVVGSPRAVRWVLSYYNEDVVSIVTALSAPWFLKVDDTSSPAWMLGGRGTGWVHLSAEWVTEGIRLPDGYPPVISGGER
jgi:hypothetical protein